MNIKKEDPNSFFIRLINTPGSLTFKEKWILKPLFFLSPLLVGLLFFCILGTLELGLHFVYMFFILALSLSFFLYGYFDCVIKNLNKFLTPEEIKEIFESLSEFPDLKKQCIKLYKEQNFILKHQKDSFINEIRKMKQEKIKEEIKEEIDQMESLTHNHLK